MSRDMSLQEQINYCRTTIHLHDNVKFTYGIVEVSWLVKNPNYGKDGDNKSSIEQYKIINKGIRMSTYHRVYNMGGDSIMEIQLMYKDENDQLQCDLLPLNVYHVKIVEVNNMQCELGSNTLAIGTDTLRYLGKVSPPYNTRW